MTTLLLTGATGLVGSRLLPRLVEAGFDCRVLVRRDTHLPPGVRAVRGDLEDPDALRKAVEGVEVVVHLAALFRTTDEAAIWRANLDGTRHLLEAVSTYAPQARFVMTSTGNVYNADAEHPGREDDVCTPTAPYPASKIAAEELVQGSGLTWAILRLPFVYGEGDGHLASILQLAPRFGLHPAHTYSVVHHRDVAIVVRMALDGLMDGRLVNVTDDAPVTVLEMSALAGDPLPGSAAPLVNPWSGRMDSTVLRRLGFRPSVSTMQAAAAEGLL